MLKLDDLPIRFRAKVKVTKGRCWEWQAARTWDGYGRYRLPDRTVRAHRYAYQLLVREIPQSVQLHHTCENHGCVNPSHLVERDANLHNHEPGHVSAVNSAKTHCPKGHAYTKQNTYINKRGARNCRKCAREASEKWRENNPTYQRDWQRRKRTKKVILFNVQ